MKPKRPFRVPVDGGCISPDNFEGKTIEGIASLEIQYGNNNLCLGELFEVMLEGVKEHEEPEILIEGGVSKVQRIGAMMSVGRITIEGDAGMSLGEKMSGGEIKVDGNVGSWTGIMMVDGKIEINGSAGDYVGAPYRGSNKGMKKGMIIIHGNAGSETGCFMRGGLIRIDGNVGMYSGVHMRGGMLLVRGNSAGRDGAQMVDGKIVICGEVPSILPTFTIHSIKSKVNIQGEEVLGPFFQFVGDLSEEGKGKLYVSKNNNPLLTSYEQYLQ